MRESARILDYRVSQPAYCRILLGHGGWFVLMVRAEYSYVGLRHIRPSVGTSPSSTWQAWLEFDQKRRVLGSVTVFSKDSEVMFVEAGM